MKFDKLPERRANRQVVFVLDQRTVDALETDPTAKSLLHREDAALIRAGVDPDATDPVTRALETQGLLRPGAVLVLDPYRDGHYAPLDKALDQFSLRKWTALSTLCGYLGAQSLSVEVVEDTISKAHTTGSIGGGRGPVKVSGKGDVTHLEEFVARMNLQDTYVGGDSDLDRATEYLAVSGLGMDPEIGSLVESRSFSGNLLAKRRLTLDLSRESARAIDLALTIKVPTVLNADTVLKYTKDNRAHYRVTLEINF